MTTKDRKDDAISTVFVESNDVDEPADLEKAISAAGYGKFNALLLLAALPIAWAGVFDTTTGAFVLASAECDLQLTFFRKGVLVAFPYVAMVLTSFLWDYATPYVGTRNLFVLALLADSVLNLLSTAVDSYSVFLLIKFLCGVLAGGPFSMAATYLSEFHSARYKPSFARWFGFLVAVGNVVPAVLGFTVLPLPWDVNVFGRRYNAWRIYLLICSIVPVFGLVAASALPQSPKYLLEAGRPDEAMKLLGTMYALNTGKSAAAFPIKAVLPRLDPRLSRPWIEASSEKLRLGWYNVKLLFSAPYLPAVSFLAVLQFGSMLGFNTMRLWVPHLFIILNNFNDVDWREDRAPTMCEMLDRRAALPAKDYLECPRFDGICLMWKINAVIYQNSSIIASSAVLFSFLSGFVTTTEIRKRIVLLTALAISMVSSFGINWAQSPPYMLTLAAAIIVTSRIAGNIVTAVNVDVIPIPLRATSLDVLTTVGNVGAIAGNFMLSALLGTDCLVAFLGLGVLFVACLCLSFCPPKPVKPSPKDLLRPAA